MSDKLQAERDRFDELAKEYTLDGIEKVFALSWFFEGAKYGKEQSALSSSQQDKALQSLADQAQELDMGYGPNACQSCGKSSQEQPSSVAMTDARKILDAIQWPVIARLLDNYRTHISGRHDEHSKECRRDIEAIHSAVTRFLQSSPKGASTGTESGDLHAIVAGALFDFMGGLTTQPERLVLSDCNEAGPAVDAIEAFAKKRGLNLSEADVFSWHASLSSPQEASKPQDEREAALEDAAKICDSVNTHDNPMTANDCADAIRALKSQPSAASGRELPKPAYTIRLNRDGTPGEISQCAQDSEMWAYGLAYAYSEEQILAALTGAAPADANVAPSDRQNMSITEMLALCKQNPVAASGVVKIAANADANVGGLATKAAALLLMVRNAQYGLRGFGDGSLTRGRDLTRDELQTITAALEAAARTTAPEPSAPADKVDALTRKQVERIAFRLLSKDAYMNFMVELDAAIARMRSEDGQGGKL